MSIRSLLRGDCSHNQLLWFWSNGQPIERSQVPHPSAHFAEGWDSTSACRVGFSSTTAIGPLPFFITTQPQKSLTTNPTRAIIEILIGAVSRGVRQPRRPSKLPQSRFSAL